MNRGILLSKGYASMNIKSLVSALAALAALGLQSATSYMATEQYVQNVVKAESNRTDIAIGELRKEVQDAKYLTPSAIKAGDNVSVTTNEAGEVTIAATDSFPADYAAVSNAAVYAAITNALQDAAISTLNDTKLDKSGGTVGTIRVYEAGDYGGNVIIASDYGTATITPDGIGFNNGRMLLFPQTQGIGTFAAVADIPTVPTAQINAATTTNALQDAAISTLNDTKADKSDLNPLLFAQYYPDGSVKSAAEFTAGIKYTLTSNATERTATVKPFCITDDQANDNSGLVGHVVIPPFVDAQGNGYISDDGTRFKVVGVGSGPDSNNSNENLTAVIAPSTVTSVEDKAFRRCTNLASVSIPAAASIGSGAFNTCTSLASVSLPAATSIGTYAFNSCTKLASVSTPAATNIRNYAFYSCTKLTSVSIPAAKSIGGHVFDACTKLASVSLPAVTSVGGSAFNNCNSLVAVSLPAVTSIDGYSFAGCTSLTSVDFGETLSSVPRLGSSAFNSVPTSCKIVVPDSLYDAWTAASGWSDLVTRGYKFLRHSEWEYARKYETFTIKVEDNVLIFSPQE